MNSEVKSYKPIKRINLIWQGLIIGSFAGLIITLYRFCIGKISGILKPLIGNASSGAAPFITALLIYMFLALAGGFCSWIEPLISGSGIPQVSAQLSGRLHPKWQKVLPLKFIGGLITLGSGLTLGREGPSVQIGASLGQGFGEIFKRPLSERRYLITGGAAAGLAAAFNAPVAGVVFALEELHRNFSALGLISAMISAFASDFVSGQLMGTGPVLSFSGVTQLPLSLYFLLILYGLATGLSSALFNKVVMLFKNIYKRMKLPVYIASLLPFMAVFLLCILDPRLFGSGEEMIFYPTKTLLPALELLILYLAKFFLLALCFGGGLPGGIFFPLLVLGSLTGQLLSQLLVGAGLLDPAYANVLSMLAMAGHFAGIVRAPLTGILLVSEMTASFAFMLPLGIISAVSYIVAELLKSEPIYESLQKALPLEGTGPRSFRRAEKILLEFAVEAESRAAGAKIKDLNFPPETLIVSIRRGSGELTPNGSLELNSGDYLLVSMPRGEIGKIKAAIEKLTLNRKPI